jgi:nucleotide-binding universal stress UspA family protein
VAGAVDWVETSDRHRVLRSSSLPRAHESSAGEDLVNLGEVADQLLMRAAAEAEGDHIEIETASREGDPAKVLSDIAAEEHARLVIVGDRGLSGVRRFLLGSVSQKLSHHSPCSLLIVRG